MWTLYTPALFTLKVGKILTNEVNKTIKELDRAVSVGPILIGLKKPIHILQLGASVDEIVNMAAISVIDSNERKIKK